MNAKGYLESMVVEWPRLAADYILIGINGEQRTQGSPDDWPAYSYTYVNFAGKSRYKGFPGTHRESPALIAEVVEELRREIKITRLFIGGHSQGAFCAYSMFMNYPHLFAGAFPISGGVVIQSEPTAYTNAAIRAQQRQGALVIIHGENDPVVRFSQGKTTYESFVNDGFPRVRFLTHKTAGHVFMGLPVEEGVRWLESITSDDAATLLAFAEKQLAARQYRDATGALDRLRDLGAEKAHRSRIQAIQGAIENEAAGKAGALLRAIREARDDSWVGDFGEFRSQFEFTDPAREVMDAYRKLQAGHEQPAEKLWWAARRDFQSGKREDGRRKCEEIVKHYYAASFYRFASQALQDPR
jgi:predicted esterase